MYHSYYQHKISEYKGGEKLPEPTSDEVDASLARRAPEYEVSRAALRAIATRH